MTGAAPYPCHLACPGSDVRSLTPVQSDSAQLPANGRVPICISDKVAPEELNEKEVHVKIAQHLTVDGHFLVRCGIRRDRLERIQILLRYHYPHISEALATVWIRLPD